MVDHDIRQMTVTRMIPVADDEGKIHWVPNPHPSAIVEVKKGCWTCNMGLEEALTLPCPGFDIFDPANLLEAADDPEA